MEDLLKVIWWGLVPGGIVFCFILFVRRILKEINDDNNQVFYTIEEMQELRDRQMKRIKQFSKK